METNTITEVAASEVRDVKNVNEQRDYCLNLQEAINKKLQATHKEEFVVSQTGGGIKFVLNTGTYEVFKLAAEDFLRIRMNQIPK